MKKQLTIFLQLVTVLIGIGALSFLIWEPLVEGRNANATLFQVYFNDPFLAYAYASSILFFVALYKAFTMFGYVRQNRWISIESLQVLRTIKYSAMSLVVLIVAPVVYLFIVRPDDDIAGGVAMGIFLILVMIVVVIISRMFEKRVQKGLGV